MSSIQAQTDDGPVIELKDYAFVSAGLADGLMLEELLGYLELDERTWQRADADWQRRLLADLRIGMRLNLELDELQREARKIWHRPIPPLDDDLRSWLDFQRGLGSQEEPAAYLASIPLRPGEVGALSQRWAARMAAEPTLMAQAGAILAEPPRPVDIPPPPPPRLPDRLEESTSGTGFFATLSDDDPLPFGVALGRSPNREVRLAPALSAPLPPPPREVGTRKSGAEEQSVDATAAVGVVFADVAMPFASPASPLDEPRSEQPEPGQPEPKQPELKQPEPKQPEPSTPQAPAPAPRVASAPTPPVPLEQSVDETTFGVTLSEESVLPFRDGAAQPPAPTAPVDDAPAPGTGETAFVDVAKLALAPTPFADQDPLAGSVDETTFGVTLSEESVLPFEAPRGDGRPPAIAAAPTDDAHAQVGETGFVDLSKIDLSAGAAFLAPKLPPIPAAGAPADPATQPLAQRALLGPGSLTMGQYAAVESEIALDASAAPRVLAAYGLDAAGRRAHAEALRVLLASDPSAREAWEQAKGTYRAWRQSL